MTTRKVIARAVLVVILLVGCGDDNGTSPGDVTAPAAITDLAITDSIGTSLVLIWTASGDDDQTGTATEYDLRYATEMITGENWDAAEPIGGLPDPAEAGADQSITIDHLAWWTRYYFAIRVRDEAGNWSSTSNIAAATPYPDPALRFLVGTRDGILSIDMEGTAETFITGTNAVEIIGHRVYAGPWGTGIDEYAADGTKIRRIPIPLGVSYLDFTALPGDRFAMMDNSSDSVHFIDDAGNLLATVGMLKAPDSESQNLDGVVVGDQLIISEDGRNHLLKVDLTTYEISVFRDLSGLSGWLGAIDYSDGEYCICQSQQIYHFAETGDLEVIATLDEDLYNITAVVIAGGHSFVTLNFAGAIYRVNNTTGEVTAFVEGLDYPQDLELLK